MRKSIDNQFRDDFMQIVIPMSGFGERFRAAGYVVPKPLIKVDGKPIIQHVVEMFSHEDDFIFICNEDHLLNPEYKMEEVLQGITPNSSIISIQSHKLGPVYAVMQALDEINLQKSKNFDDYFLKCFLGMKRFISSKNSRRDARERGAESRKFFRIYL